jgi:hypothetical protein
MYSIFFHLSSLALIEILFYFLYVGPMETQIFKNALKEATQTPPNLFNPINIQNPINTTEFIQIEESLEANLTNSYKQKMYSMEQERLKNNDELFTQALEAWSVILTISIVFAALEMSFRYYLFTRNLTKIIKKDPSITNIPHLSRNPHSPSSPHHISIELAPYEQHVNIEQTFEQQIITATTPTSNFFDWHKIRKMAALSSAHAITLAGLIIGFEYWFFNHIILRYRIVSKDEIIYMMLEEIQPLLSTYIHVSQNDPSESL